MMVQLIRTEPALPEPTRQVVVNNRWGRFVARVDLAWPDHGIFLELDGQHHLGQPLYDANRQTAVVATKGWLPGRFTWHEVTRTPRPTVRRLVELFDRVTVTRNRAASA
jgi:very-short-patch-repair endonuclease